MSKRVALLAAFLLLAVPVARAAAAVSPPTPEFGEPEPGTAADRAPVPTGPLAYTVVGTPPAEQVELPPLRPYRNVRSDTVTPCRRAAR